MELGEVFAWMDKNPEIVVGVITGSGRAFCAGANLDGTFLTSQVLFCGLFGGLGCEGLGRYGGIDRC